MKILFFLSVFDLLFRVLDFKVSNSRSSPVCLVLNVMKTCRLCYRLFYLVWFPAALFSLNKLSVFLHFGDK